MVLGGGQWFNGGEGWFLGGVVKGVLKVLKRLLGFRESEERFLNEKCEWVFCELRVNSEVMDGEFVGERRSETNPWVRPLVHLFSFSL